MNLINLKRQAFVWVMSVSNTVQSLICDETSYEGEHLSLNNIFPVQKRTLRWCKKMSERITWKIQLKNWETPRNPNVTELRIMYLTILVPISQEEGQDCLFASESLESLFLAWIFVLVINTTFWLFWKNFINKFSVELETETRIVKLKKNLLKLGPHSFFRQLLIPAEKDTKIYSRWQLNGSCESGQESQVLGCITLWRPLSI